LRVQSAISAAVTTITKRITVAAGVFAPGHLGELTQIVLFELVEAVVADARTTERRLRLPPSRVGIYFVLALGLLPGRGYLGVWGKLTSALDGLGLAAPSPRALRDLRRRLGAAPLKALFEVRAGSAAWRPGRAPRVCALAGTAPSLDGVQDDQGSRRLAVALRSATGFVSQGSACGGGCAAVDGQRCAVTSQAADCRMTPSGPW
jgi:hypothetical protein